jgi:hypothetical protein
LSQKSQIESILENLENLEKFLIKNGYDEEDLPLEKYSAKFFKIDDTSILALTETTDKDQISKIRNYFINDVGLTYCCIYCKGKVLFFRNYGAIKKFIYSERTKDNPSKLDSLNKIRLRFDIIFELKDISKEFYKQFKLERDSLVNKISNNYEREEKYLLTQKIFDRIFFIYFLCHKKIVTRDNDAELSGNTLFSIISEQDNVHEELNKLFDSFNKSVDSKIILENLIISIPYLNGDLFRITKNERNLVFDMASREWKSIFKFLNQYHWIVDDDFEDVDDGENSLTPEILGHVYERSVIEWETAGFGNSIESSDEPGERKGKGVFYTPSWITRPICEGVVNPYILDNFKNKYSTILKLKKGPLIDLKKAIKFLDNVTVLDPACGSGAFLVTVAELIFRLKIEFLRLSGEKIDNYKIKLEIITNNIFGVDILRGAIEIAKLRLWLWLVSSYNVKGDVRPLPNIEYNLRVGDSLVGWLDETINHQSMNAVLDPLIAQHFNILKDFLKNGKLQKLESAEKLFESTNVEQFIEAEQILLSIYKKSSGGEKKSLKKIIDSSRKFNTHVTDDVYFISLNKKIKENYKIQSPPVSRPDYDDINSFHWGVNFTNIIQSGGFDIVIGNPPYVEIKKILDWKKIILRKQFTYENKEIMNGRFDLYWGFLKRGVSLVKDDGFLGFLTADSLLDSVSGALLRKFLFTETTILGLKWTGKFPDAGVHTVITLLKNKLNQSNYKFELENWEESTKKTLDKEKILNQHNYIVNLKWTNQEENNDQNNTLLNELEKNSIILEQILYLQQGMILQCGSGKDKKTKAEYIFGEKKRNFLPYIEGKDTERYFLPEKHRWVNYKPNEHHRPRMKEVFENTKLLVRRISTDSLVTMIDDGYFFTDNTLYTGTRWNDLKKIRPEYKVQISKAENKISKTFKELCDVSEKFEYEYLLALINSRLLTFYYEKKFNTKSINVLVKCYIKETSKNNQKIIGMVARIIQILNSKNIQKHHLDYDVLDCLIYEIYLQDSLKTNLMSKVEYYLKRFDKKKSKDFTLDQCKKINKEIEDDKNISLEIKKIRSNKMVKIVEKDTGFFVPSISELV